MLQVAFIAAFILCCFARKDFSNSIYYPHTAAGCWPSACFSTHRGAAPLLSGLFWRALFRCRTNARAGRHTWQLAHRSTRRSTQQNVHKPPLGRRAHSCRPSFTLRASPAAQTPLERTNTNDRLFTFIGTVLVCAYTSWTFYRETQRMQAR